MWHCQKIQVQQCVNCNHEYVEESGRTFGDNPRKLITIYGHQITTGHETTIENLVEVWYSLEQYIGLKEDTLPSNQCTVPENTKLLQD